MHSIQIIETQTTLKFPEAAFEFTKQQVIAFAELALLYQSGTINYNTLKTRMVYRFLNMKRTANLTTDKNQQIVENIYNISKLIDNYFIDTRINAKPVKQIKMEFFAQKLPEIKVNNRVFYGPDDALFNTVYGEYLQLTTLLTEYTKNQEEHTLNQLIATIYRPQKPNYNTLKTHPDFDGDKRIKFNPALTPNYAIHIASLPYTIKYAIFLFVASSQHFIATNTALPIGGGNTIDLTILFQSTNTTTTNSLGMVGTLYSLAETKVFGDVDKVAKKNTYDILAFLVNQTQQYNNLKNTTHATTT